MPSRRSVLIAAVGAGLAPKLARATSSGFISFIERPTPLPPLGAFFNSGIDATGATAGQLPSAIGNGNPTEPFGLIVPGGLVGVSSPATPYWFTSMMLKPLPVTAADPIMDAMHLVTWFSPYSAEPIAVLKILPPGNYNTVVYGQISFPQPVLSTFVSNGGVPYAGVDQFQNFLTPLPWSLFSGAAFLLQTFFNPAGLGVAVGGTSPVLMVKAGTAGEFHVQLTYYGFSNLGIGQVAPIFNIPWGTVGGTGLETPAAVIVGQDPSLINNQYTPQPGDTLATTLQNNAFNGYMWGPLISEVNYPVDPVATELVFVDTISGNFLAPPIDGSGLLAPNVPSPPIYMGNDPAAGFGGNTPPATDYLEVDTNFSPTPGLTAPTDIPASEPSPYSPPTVAPPIYC